MSGYPFESLPNTHRSSVERTLRPCSNNAFGGASSGDHWLPFQCATRAWARCSFALRPIPTAQISFAETAATLEKMPSVSGEPPCDALLPSKGTNCQPVPSQCSSKGRLSRRVASPKEPTAQMLFAETTASALKEPLPSGLFGLGTTLQCLPFQCSISVLRFEPIADP